MKLLCLSDIHGNIDAVKAMVEDTHRRDIEYDAVIVAGDITNAVVTGDLCGAQLCLDSILSILVSEYGKVYIVPGNRDYIGRGKNRKTLVFRHGVLLEPGKKYRLAASLEITSSPELTDENTILVQHSCNRYLGGFKRISVISSKAFLHIAGHTHTGVFTRNYLNTCFLYRDDSNGAKPIMGGYFDVDINGREVTVKFNALGPVRRKALKVRDFSGSIYAPYGNSFPVALTIE